MILPPKCFKRKCIHYGGVKQPDGTEMNEFVYCDAYPCGIPSEIAYGNDKHLTVRSDQKNNIVFETEKVNLH